MVSMPAYDRSGATACPIILATPGVETPPRMLERGLLLLTPPGTAINQPGLERALSCLHANPHVVAVIDVPEQETGSPVPLDLLLAPDHVGAILARAETLQACSLRFPFEGTLARAEIATCIASTFEVLRAEAPMASSCPQPAPSREEISRFARYAIRAFALEDLHPSLRTNEGAGALSGAALDLACRLLERGGGWWATGFMIGNWAEDLLQGRDHGFGLGVVPETNREEPRSGAGLLRLPPPDPLVSLIIPTLNRPAMLSRALASVAAQTFDDLEIIVVNDGGTDPGPTIEPFRQSARGRDRLTVVHHDRNRGLPVARSTGLRLARGRYVGFLDDDDCLLPHHLSALIPRLRLGARVVHADVRSVMEDPAEPLPVSHATTVHYQREYDEAAFHLDNYIPVHSVLCEHSLILESGGFDETLPVLEDWDLWLRVFQRARPVHVRRITSEVRTRSDESNMTREKRQTWSDVRAHIYGKTLELEHLDSTLRNRRVQYLRSLESMGREPFPRKATQWLQGNSHCPAIDPDKPTGS